MYKFSIFYLEQVKQIPDKEPWNSEAICFVIVLSSIKVKSSLQEMFQKFQ